MEHVEGKTMKKISQVLIESQKTRKQIYGNLIGKDIDGNIIEYCALGALACEAKLEFDRWGAVPYELIFESYGIDPSTIVKMPKGNTLEGKEVMIKYAVYRLNDFYEWDFKKIGKWLGKLEDEGVIKYEKD